MLRYKESLLLCNKNQTPMKLLDLVMKRAKKLGCKVRRCSTFEKDDTLAVYMKIEDFPEVRVMILAKNEAAAVSVINIVPIVDIDFFDINRDDYNDLLDIFTEDIFNVISLRDGNVLKTQSDEYEFADIIPHSYDAFKEWISHYPISGHISDIERWFDFVIALHKNNEKLTVRDFEKHLDEDYCWDAGMIREFSLKLESQLDLLAYYEKHR